MTDRILDLRQTKAYLAVRLRSLFFRPISLAIYALVIVPFAVPAALHGRFEPLLVAVCLVLGFLWVLRRFTAWLSRNDLTIDTGTNLADELSYHMVEHWCAKTELTPSTMLEAATESVRGVFVLHQIGIEGAELLRAWKEHPELVNLDQCLMWGAKARDDLKIPKIDSTATIYAFFTNVPSMETLLNAADISREDLKAILKAEAFHFYWTERHSHPWSPDSLVRVMGAVGKSWVVGYNTELERLTSNISGPAMSYARDAVIHAEQVNAVFGRLIGGAQKNMLLVGKPGSGRRTLTRNIAAMLRTHELKRGLLFTDVLKLQTAELLSGSARGDTELLTALKKAVESGSFILVIEDLPLLLEGSDAKLKDVLLMLLQAKNLKTIGIIDRADYHARVKTEPALDVLFEKILLSDCSDDEVMAVLLEEYFTMERCRSVRITHKTLKSIVNLSRRFITGQAMPGKAVDVLREAVSRARSRGDRTVAEDDVREVVSVEARVDVRQLSENDRVRLLNLEERLKSHVIGHREALSSIASALKRARMDLGTRKRPMGTFLFLGTTGVGKTETAKALAEEYFGSEGSFIRVDMNEYGNPDSSALLIGGSTKSGFTEGFLTKRVQDRPFSLVLLDEVEKAHPSILHLFLQVLDEGVLLDGNGDATDFKNTIIIATSNAGSRWIAEHPAPTDPAAKEAYRKALIDEVILEKAFSPEFLNRFDETTVFYPPSQDEIKQIAILMLDGIIRDIEQKRGIRVTVESGVIDMLAVRGYHPEYGAREMRRVITRSVETFLADYVLKRTVKRGEEIMIRTEDIVKGER